jgi:hypothetical protein
MPALLIIALAAGLGAEPPAAAAPAAKPAKEALVCTYESQPDSHFKKRVCLTKAQRDERARLEREHLMTSQRAFCSGKDC